MTKVLAVGVLLSASTGARSQCTTWVNPSPTTGWVDFNNNFGGAPCDDGSGCPFNEITDFEIFADEAYRMDNVIQGGTYTFSACNGTGGTAWNIEYTIIAPSGAVDASGLNAGSICELTWTASEAGTYLIVVSEAGACGTSTNAAVANGFPAITCVSGATCPEPQPGCTTWVNPSPTTGWSDFNSNFGGAPCDDGSGCPFNEITDFEVFADEAYAMDNVIQGGTYTFSACNGTGGTAWNMEFTIIAPSGTVDAFGVNAGSTCELTWTASEAGTYLIVVSEVGACGTSTNAAVANGFPAITCVSGALCGADAIADRGNMASLNMFPNPTSGIFTLSLPKELGSKAIVDVLDMSGRVVLNTNMGINSTAATLDLSAQAEGTYMVRVSSNGQVLRSKLVLMGR
ncbi:MAG: T9SS type A sorting domain-containing protein [Flavobacteriales bacterium]|nr:T9SS type A sorting domain-containing protein [Flavobacteriales bacterium]